MHGDILSCDTRSVLSILNMTEVEFEYKEQKRTKDMMRNLSSSFDSFNVDYISKVVPVIEENEIKRIGSGQHIIEYVTFKDKRNDPKFDDKGKLIKKPKGWKPVKSLHPQELRLDIDRHLNWFMTKLRPYSNHLFNTMILKPVNSLKDDEQNKMAEAIKDDMEHLK